MSVLIRFYLKQKTKLRNQKKRRRDVNGNRKRDEKNLNARDVSFYHHVVLSYQSHLNIVLLTSIPFSLV